MAYDDAVRPGKLFHVPLLHCFGEMCRLNSGQRLGYYTYEEGSAWPWAQGVLQKEI